MSRILLIGALLLSLAACTDEPKPSSLYGAEKLALEAHTDALTEWAKLLLSQVAQNDQDVQSAFELVEIEQKRNLTETELQAFDQVQQDLQRRSAEISQLLDQGNELQVELFSSLYQLLGKLDAGAEFCNLSKAGSSSLALVSEPSQAALPELESAYSDALIAGELSLRNNAHYPCSQFDVEYQPLLTELRQRIEDVNSLMGSLIF